MNRIVELELFGFTKTKHADVAHGHFTWSVLVVEQGKFVLETC